jgi:hypothetical protein
MRGSNLTANNLGGMGPNFDDEPEMRFENVGEYEGRQLDLVVTNVTTYLPRDCRAIPSPCPPNGMGGNGTLGLINIRLRRRTDFRFCFVDHESGNETQMTRVDFDLYDLDNGPRPGADVAEDRNFTTVEVHPPPINDVALDQN